MMSQNSQLLRKRGEEARDGEVVERKMGVVVSRSQLMSQHDE
jgi:hypothetical protein